VISQWLFNRLSVNDGNQPQERGWTAACVLAGVATGRPAPGVESLGGTTGWGNDDGGAIECVPDVPLVLAAAAVVVVAAAGAVDPVATALVQALGPRSSTAIKRPPK